MPALNIDDAGVPAVLTFAELLKQLLDEASVAKQTTTVEPPLSKVDFANLSDRVAAALPPVNETETDGETTLSESSKNRRNAVVETAARNLFGKLIATTSIDAPEFVTIWNLMDILSTLSDDGWCDPALLFWLIEELLESQTIAGCRKIFDYLESRRERITANHFKQKQLVILRACNELLRRLSRAEDTSFCGRVFIFLFQSFPLGDRSSVNLRGEYHTENVTAYDARPEDGAKMDVDSQVENDKNEPESQATPKPLNGDAKAVEKPMQTDDLYPLFWSLQETFSQPMKLFDESHFGAFKHSLQETMRSFQAIPNTDDSRNANQLKRKRDDGDAEAPETFNPKYLTNKDLFKLEISDLSFRRNVLVQALIVIDFLLSLTPESKEKLSTVSASNRSVLYSAQLKEADVKWSNDMKEKISNYIKSSSLDGAYFYRMVETVLARDKNWVFWKIENCPPIKRDPVSPEAYLDARSSAQRMATSKRLRPMPMGAVSLDFLRDEDEEAALDKLRSGERSKLPELDDFKRKIADDDFEIEMPTNAQTKAAAVAGKSSKSWRALRIAGRFKLAAFDKIDDSKKIEAVFEELKDEEEEDAEPKADEADMPANRDPIVLGGAVGVGKTAVIQNLLDAHPGVFTVVIRHTTREPNEGEVNGKEFHFVKKQEYSQMRDGDRLVEYGERDGVDYGTSTKVVDAITEAGKIPILELDPEAAQFAKDMSFTARYILLRHPSEAALQESLEKAGKEATIIQKIIAQIPEVLDEDKISELYDTTVVNDDVDEAAKALDNYIFGKDAEKGAEVDSEMVDAGADQETAAKDDEDAS